MITEAEINDSIRTIRAAFGRGQWQLGTNQSIELIQLMEDPAEFLANLETRITSFRLQELDRRTGLITYEHFKVERSNFIEDVLFFIRESKKAWLENRKKNKPAVQKEMAVEKRVIDRLKQHLQFFNKKIISPDLLEYILYFNDSAITKTKEETRLHVMENGTILVSHHVSWPVKILLETIEQIAAGQEFFVFLFTYSIETMEVFLDSIYEEEGFNREDLDKMLTSYELFDDLVLRLRKELYLYPGTREKILLGELMFAPYRFNALEIFSD